MRTPCLITTLSLCLSLAKIFSIREANIASDKSKLNSSWQYLTISACVKQFHKEYIYDKINGGYL